jgi:hypothetical protein
MELDELKNAWAEHGRALETSLKLNRALLTESTIGPARSALKRRAAFLAIEATLTLLAVAALGGFVYAHLREPRFLLTGLALDGLTIAVLADLIRQIILTRQIDYAQPVGVIQRHVAELRLMRIHHVRRVLLGATLAWVLLLVVALRAFAHVDAYRVLPTAWLLGNVAFGAAMIPLGLWLSRRFADRMDRSPFLQQLMRDIAGRDIQTAERSLARVAEFEKE